MQKGGGLLLLSKQNGVFAGADFIKRIDLREKMFFLSEISEFYCRIYVSY